MAPIKLFKVKEMGELGVTNEILEEIKDKDRALKTTKRTGKAEDLVTARIKRNRVGRLVESAKSEFFKGKQKELADYPKKFWRLVKSIVPSNKNNTSKIILSDNTEGKEHELDEREAAGHINEYFCGIGP